MVYRHDYPGHPYHAVELPHDGRWSLLTGSHPYAPLACHHSGAGSIDGVWRDLFCAGSFVIGALSPMCILYPEN